MRVCPRCASTGVETTVVGYYGLDMNKATCRGPGCGWVGRAHEMATTEAGAEAAFRALRNVLALSHRLAKTDPENAAHLRRFCAEAGVAPSITREEP